MELYVSPDGNDLWSGKTIVPNVDRTDGPFRTVKRALDAIRALKKQGSLTAPLTVYLRGGTYFLDETLSFTAEDSGTEESPITFAAYQDEQPVISGGLRISGWEQVQVNGRQLWSAKIPEVRDGKWFFRQLWVNGERRIRARHPNRGYLRVDEALDVTPKTPWNEGQTRFRFRAGDLQSWNTITDAEVIVMNRWVESHLPVLGVDEKERIVSFRKRSVFKLDPGDLYYVEHALELLDEPGEWYLDLQTGTLYYMPLPGEDMRMAEVIAPRLTQLVRLVGAPQEGRYVEHFVFRGLTFAHTEWYFPPDYRPGGSAWLKPDIGGFPQAAIVVPGAVYGEGIRHVTFEDCNVGHVGTYGIELARGCQNNSIRKCRLFDLGAGGIKIGETQAPGASPDENESEQTYGNEVVGCSIYDGGKVFHSAVGLWVGQSHDNRIVHNSIHDFYYTAISIGWTWGYGRSLAYGNLMEANHIHHIGIRSDGDGPILSDMGGVYTLGIQLGTAIRNNLFHDIAGYRYGGWGIYFDEGSTGIVAENNIVIRTTHGGFHQHYGKENIVRNNIFLYGRDQQIQATRPEEHLRFRFEGNIVVWREEMLIAGNINDFNFAFDRNLYWPEGGAGIRIGELSWDQWRAKGMDKGSLIADPLFVAPEKGDFRLKPDSPAFELGFRPISMEHIGSEE